MNALIDPSTSVSYIQSWTTGKSPSPIYAVYLNSARVCQVDQVTFEVAEPIFWIVCDSNVIADQFYCDTVTFAINPVVNAIEPTSPKSTQPASTGTQTL